MRDLKDASILLDTLYSQNKNYSILVKDLQSSLSKSDKRIANLLAENTEKDNLIASQTKTIDKLNNRAKWLKRGLVIGLGIITAESLYISIAK